MQPNYRSRLSNNVYCIEVSEVMREIFSYVTHFSGHFIDTWWLLSWILG